MNYRGITYFKFLQHSWIYFLWRRSFCKRDIHLLDEAESIDAHYLVCDACGLMIYIKSISEEYMRGEIND